MTDPTLPLALILACALAVVFDVRWRNARRRCVALEAERDFQARRVAQQDQTISELLDKLAATEAALTKAVEAEYPRGAA